MRPDAQANIRARGDGIPEPKVAGGTQRSICSSFVRRGDMRKRFTPQSGAMNVRRSAGIDENPQETHGPHLRKQDTPEFLLEMVRSPIDRKKAVNGRKRNPRWLSSLLLFVWNTRVLNVDVRHVCDTCFDKGKTESCLVKAPAMRTGKSVLVVSELLCTGVQANTERHTRKEMREMCSCW